MFTLDPVGYVRSEAKEPSRRDWAAIVSEIVIKPELSPALDSLEEFSHVLVLYWMHLLPPAERLVLKVHPRREPALPLVGVFAARSPARPNPLGLCTARVLGRQGTVLRVLGLDAVDGTPVIDLKPYLPGYDCAAGASLPTWASEAGKHEAPG